MHSHRALPLQVVRRSHEAAVTLAGTQTAHSRALQREYWSKEHIWRVADAWGAAGRMPTAIFVPSRNTRRQFCDFLSRGTPDAAQPCAVAFPVCMTMIRAAVGSSCDEIAEFAKIAAAAGRGFSGCLPLLGPVVGQARRRRTHKHRNYCFSMAGGEVAEVGAGQKPT
jgi:hypothetical protein